MIQSLRSLLQSTPAQLTAIAAATALSVAPEAASTGLTSPPATTCTVEVTRLLPFEDGEELLLDRDAWNARETVSEFLVAAGEPGPESDELARFLSLSYEDVDARPPSALEYYWKQDGDGWIRVCRVKKSITLADPSLEYPLTVDLSWESTL